MRPLELERTSKAVDAEGIRTKFDFTCSHVAQGNQNRARRGQNWRPKELDCSAAKGMAGRPHSAVAKESSDVIAIY